MCVLVGYHAFELIPCSLGETDVVIIERWNDELLEFVTCRASELGFDFNFVKHRVFSKGDVIYLDVVSWVLWESCWKVANCSHCFKHSENAKLVCWNLVDQPVERRSEAFDFFFARSWVLNKFLSKLISYIDIGFLTCHLPLKGGEDEGKQKGRRNKWNKKQKMNVFKWEMARKGKETNVC